MPLWYFIATPRNGQDRSIQSILEWVMNPQLSAGRGALTPPRNGANLAICRNPLSMACIALGDTARQRTNKLRQHRTIPALRLKHRSGSCGTASALPKCSIMSGCGTRIVLRGQKPLALCDRCPCFGSLFPPLAALTFAASSIICAFGLASAAPRSPYRHLELCGIALNVNHPRQNCRNTPTRGT